MTQNAFLRARINEEVKNEAAAVLAEMGLTVSDAIRIFLTRVARDKALPFELKVPNRETAQAIKELKEGQGVKFNSKSEFFKDLRL
jgi:DNA-damage-inducible protein J